MGGGKGNAGPVMKKCKDMVAVYIKLRRGDAIAIDVRGSWVPLAQMCGDR